MAPIASAEFTFADGSGGHACALGSAPSVGQTDVLCVNSNTVVSTPSGFTAAEVAVTNQGAYIFTRLATGGESSSVTITTSGDHNTQVSWTRWANLTAVDTSTNTQANASVGGATPAHSTGVMAESTELVIALGALHSIQTANQTSPVWSSGYTAIATAVQGSGATGVRGYTGYKEGAGTAAETPSVSWTGDGCFNRYMLTVSFTVSASSPVTGTLAAALPMSTASMAGSESIPGTLAAVLLMPTGSLAGTQSVPGVLVGTLPMPTGSFAGGLAIPVSGTLAGVLPLLTGSLAGSTEDNGGGLDIAAVMQAIADQLSAIPDLRVFGWPARSIHPPAAIVTYPDGVEYDVTYGRGTDRIPALPVVVVVGAADARSTRDRLARYANSAGTYSVKAVIEAGDYGDVFDEVTVTRAGFDAVSIGGTEYMAILFDLEIVGSGGGR
jgi:hypothetical protein